MDDVNEMNEVDRTEPAHNGETVGRAGVDRRTMLKAAVATGVVAGTWVAPRIETFGFAPAGAATICQIENPSTDDLNSNLSNNTYFSSGRVRCGHSFGPSGGQPDRIVFKGKGNNPFLPNCDQVVVRTRPEDCPPVPVPGNDQVLDPDISGFAVVIDNAAGQTDPDCNCRVTKVTIYSSNRASIIATFDITTNPGLAYTCNTAGGGVPAGGGPPNGPGIRVNLPCNIDSDARLAVTISCTTTGACPT